MPHKTALKSGDVQILSVVRAEDGSLQLRGVNPDLITCPEWIRATALIIGAASNSLGIDNELMTETAHQQLRLVHISTDVCHAPSRSAA